MDLSGPKDLAALDEKGYVALCCDEYSEFMKVYFIVHKDDDA